MTDHFTRPGTVVEFVTDWDAEQYALTLEDALNERDLTVIESVVTWAGGHALTLTLDITKPGPLALPGDRFHLGWRVASGWCWVLTFAHNRGEGHTGELDTTETADPDTVAEAVRTLLEPANRPAPGRPPTAPPPGQPDPSAATDRNNPVTTKTPLVRVVSFGYGHDDPPTATVTYDLRVLFRNPHRDPAMRYLTGLDDAVYTHVLATPGIERIAAGAADTALGLLAETGGPVVIATGCVGGRHRSVGMARRIAEHLHAAGVDVDTDHRDVHRDVLPTTHHTS